MLNLKVALSLSFCETDLGSWENKKDSKLDFLFYSLYSQFRNIKITGISNFALIAVVDRIYKAKHFGRKYSKSDRFLKILRPTLINMFYKEIKSYCNRK